MQNIIGHFGPNALKGKKSPTSSAHNSFIKTPNDAKFESIFIVLKRYTTFMLEVFSFEVFIIKTEGLEHWPNLETLPFHVLHLAL